jgi:hypothetical protein
MATAADGERRVRRYLRQHAHDIFVSYAHAEALNDWSKRLVDEARNLVARASASGRPKTSICGWTTRSQATHR